MQESQNRLGHGSLGVATCSQRRRGDDHSYLACLIIGMPLRFNGSPRLLSPSCFLDGNVGLGMADCCPPIVIPLNAAEHIVMQQLA